MDRMGTPLRRLAQDQANQRTKRTTLPTAAAKWAMRTGKRPVEVFGSSLYRIVSIRVAVDPRFVMLDDGRFVEHSDKVG